MNTVRLGIIHTTVLRHTGAGRGANARKTSDSSPKRQQRYVEPDPQRLRISTPMLKGRLPGMVWWDCWSTTVGIMWPKGNEHNQVCLGEVHTTCGATIRASTAWQRRLCACGGAPKTASRPKSLQDNRPWRRSIARGCNAKHGPNEAPPCQSPSPRVRPRLGHASHNPCLLLERR